MLAVVAASGGDSVSIDGLRPTSSQILSDPTQRDFIAELQGDDNSAHGPGAIGGAVYDSLLQTLRAYQGKTIADGSDATASGT